jgi:hypothetical protein
MLGILPERLPADPLHPARPPRPVPGKFLLLPSALSSVLNQLHIIQYFFVKMHIPRNEMNGHLDKVFIPETPEQNNAQDKTVQQNIDERI